MNHEHAHTSRLKLAHSATWHCLIGCGLGDVVGTIVGTGLRLSSLASIFLAVLLGFVFGFALGLWPLLRARFVFSLAVRQMLLAAALSIAVMKFAEVLIQVYTPGIMDAGLTSAAFWLGLGLALTAGYLAAFPLNFILVDKGIRHIH